MRSVHQISLLRLFAGVYITSTLLALGLWKPGSGMSAGLDTWHLRNPNRVPYRLNTVIHAAGVYVATGEAGNILASTNGLQWASVNYSPLYAISSICYGNGMFLGVGSPN